MTEKLYINKLQKKYKISYLHNPKHFFLNTLYIEKSKDRVLLCAHPRPHSKQFHVLAILKLRGIDSRQKKFVVDNIRKSSKPFGGVFQD